MENRVFIEDNIEHITIDEIKSYVKITSRGT